MQAGRGEYLGKAFEPVVDLVRGESLELQRAELRDEVFVDEDSVRLDGLLAEVSSSSLKPVADGFAYGVAVAGPDACVQVIDGPDEPVLDLLLGATFLLDPYAVA